MSAPPTPQHDAAVTSITEVVLPGVIEPAGLQVRTRSLSAPAVGQVVVAVEASGVSMAEQAMRKNRYPGQPKFPFVPGYDLVGTVAQVGPGVDAAMVGRRVAALTKTGGWASGVLLPAADLVPVPAGLDPAEAETVVVNGITAWQMLHRTARVQHGQTILVHGANGGVGTTLVQLARHSGIRVIGTASPRHHSALRELGVLPVDYNDPDLAARVRELAPDGVDAAFDHIGGDSLKRSYSLLAKDGTLVSYSLLKETGPMIPAFVAMLARLALWNRLPNGHAASFYNVWTDHTLRPARFRARLHADLTAVFGLLADGTLAAQVAARIPLTQAREAMELAESHTALGKVVLIPSCA
ncbi:MAG: medium chain dehydrogenase/reductase family protein [Ornithinimicrobium sp.]